MKKLLTAAVIGVAGVGITPAHCATTIGGMADGDYGCGVWTVPLGVLITDVHVLESSANATEYGYLRKVDYDGTWRCYTRPELANDDLGSGDCVIKQMHEQLFNRENYVYEDTDTAQIIAIAPTFDIGWDDGYEQYNCSYKETPYQYVYGCAAGYYGEVTIEQTTDTKDMWLPDEGNWNAELLPTCTKCPDGGTSMAFSGKVDDCYSTGGADTSGTFIYNSTDYKNMCFGSD